MQTFYFFALLALVALLGGGAMVGALVSAAGFGLVSEGKAPEDEGDDKYSQLKVAFFLSVGLALIAAFLFAMLGYLIGAP